MAASLTKVGRYKHFVLEAGPADGLPILLFHGFPESHLAWQGLAPSLAEAGYRVLMPDLLGYGKSTKPQESRAYTLDALAQDWATYLRHTLKQPVRLIGHDWGGALAWHLALHYPTLIDKVAILNMPHPEVLRLHLRRSLAQQLRSWYMVFFQLPYLPEAALRAGGGFMLRRMLQRTALPGAFPPGYVETLSRAWLQPGTLRAMLNWYRALRYAPLGHSPSVTQAGCPPTLLLWGDADAFLGKEMAPPSASWCDDGHLITYSGYTHWLHHEAPHLVARHLLDFFAGVNVYPNRLPHLEQAMAPTLPLQPA